MSGKKFEYGLFSTGIFTALLWLTPLVGFLIPGFLIHYVFMILFLGFGLRPLIEKTGIYEIYQKITYSINEKMNRKRNQQLQTKLSRKMRDDKLRHSRKKDPRLPPRW